VPDFVVHERALCESEAVGPGTQIGAFTHVLAGAQIGADCQIRDGVFIDAGVTIAHGVTVGANATILAGVEIGRGATVGAGAVVTRSVPPNAIVTGNPARIDGYTETPRSEAQAQSPSSRETGGREPGTVELEVRGVSLKRLAEVKDLRGSLTAGEMPTEGIPFIPQRWFLVYNVPSREIRGEHAHHVCHQYLVCVAGSMTVAVDDGERRAEIVLDEPTLGLHIPPLVWASQFRYNSDSVLLVLASHAYDPADYIRDYERFLLAAGEAQASR
jgi:UDP-2-acetamido-3-amino-2,3-dideoxy-glucuronate N-acetyltransferase